MTPRTVSTRIAAQAVSEGAGVTVHRTIGTAARRHLDPFLMLDHFGSDDPDQYIAGFPAHPHRGFITLTYMLDGHMRHQDSMGNQGDLRAGGAQWMRAASGVIHSEMPQQDQGLMRGFQLWINLPAAEKMSDPAYQEIEAASIPESRVDGASVRVLAGTCHGLRGPIEDHATAVTFLDVKLEAKADFHVPLPPGHAAFVYLYEGSGQVAGEALNRHELAVLEDGDGVAVRAAERGARFIVVAGQPIGEPIVQYGPFVMNRPEEIEQAMRDYRDDRLVQRKAAFHVR